MRRCNCDRAWRPGRFRNIRGTARLGQLDCDLVCCCRSDDHERVLRVNWRFEGNGFRFGLVIALPQGTQPGERPTPVPVAFTGTSVHIDGGGCHCGCSVVAVLSRVQPSVSPGLRASVSAGPGLELATSPKGRGQFSPVSCPIPGRCQTASGASTWLSSRCASHTRTAGTCGSVDWTASP